MSKNAKLNTHVVFTLQEIVKGGIYDQIGGGLARYSVDAEWFAPHFEKMLYDNGQFLSLLSHVYTQTENEEFEIAIEQTIQWLQREMLDQNGGFYSALDADSEGVEGKYYTWTSDEFVSTLKSKFTLEQINQLKKYWSIDQSGNWEHGVNILDRSMTFTEFEIDNPDFGQTLRRARQTLLEKRDRRVHPGLDDKILTSWNALIISGLVDSYFALDKSEFLNLAIENANFLIENLIENGLVFHSFKIKRSESPGFLEDYAFLIEALIKLYEATLDEKWLLVADKLASKTIESFYDEHEGFFFFTSQEAEKLIARKKEIFDNVVPSSNATLIDGLFKLSILLDKPVYEEIAQKSSLAIKKLLETEIQYLYKWADVVLTHQNQREVSLVGPRAKEWSKLLKSRFLVQNVLINGCEKNSELPILKVKQTKNDQTAIYICRHKSCLAPVYSIDDAITILNSP